MTQKEKEELIDEAKRRYPEGTNVKSLFEDYKGVIWDIDYTHMDVDEEKIWMRSKKNGLIVWRKGGQWATILEPAPTKEINFSIF